MSPLVWDGLNIPIAIVLYTIDFCCTNQSVTYLFVSITCRHTAFSSMDSHINVETGLVVDIETLTALAFTAAYNSVRVHRGCW